MQFFGDLETCCHSAKKAEQIRKTDLFIYLLGQPQYSQIPCSHFYLPNQTSCFGFPTSPLRLQITC